MPRGLLFNIKKVHQQYIQGGLIIRTPAHKLRNFSQSGPQTHSPIKIQIKGAKEG